MPFYSAIWEAAKASRGLVAFHRRFYWDQRPTRDSKKSAQNNCALIDVLAHDGEEWIKVSTVTESRLQFEIAKAQWEAQDSSSEEDAENSEEESKGLIGKSNDGGQVTGEQEEEDELDRIELVRMAKDLRRASRSHRIHYDIPRVRFVLSKISDPPPIELQPLLDRIRMTGAIVNLGSPPPIAQSVDFLKSDVFPRLLPSPHPLLTDTLNIDCTILLALVSDLSHTAKHPILPTYNEAIKRQIHLESQDHLLPSSLWPAMASKRLVCTEKAARRMREIVDTIGMPNERARTEALLADGSVAEMDGPDDDQTRRQQSLAKLSDHTVPISFRLPIAIVPSLDAIGITAAIHAGTLPAIAAQIAEALTEINRSVFIYGWVNGLTTVSSNRSVANAIENMVEKDGQGARGPEIWLREPARSLLGKEKERRK